MKSPIIGPLVKRAKKSNGESSFKERGVDRASSTCLVSVRTGFAVIRRSLPAAVDYWAHNYNRTTLGMRINKNRNSKGGDRKTKIVEDAPGFLEKGRGTKGK